MNCDTRLPHRSISAQTRIRATAFAVLCSLAAAGAFADQAAGPKDHEVTVVIQVSTQEFDLSQPAAAQKLYWRLQKAAWVACTSGNRVGLAPSPDPTGCRDKTLADAIRSADLTPLTQVYLASHTLREAPIRGFGAPAQMAVK